MEMIFPPGFFTVMVHLVVRLASECQIAGPVAYQWMYFIERYLGELKSFVRNKARPEGSIAESFLADVCMKYCSRYPQGFSTKHNQPSRNDDNPKDSKSSIFSQQSMLFPPAGKPLGRPMVHTLTD
uniref:DUF4218 domain-containing protein n=1 Tax=Triticum urartu TaxID=4572 RepID=A0A8R7TYA5_TRIUA